MKLSQDSSIESRIRAAASRKTQEYLHREAKWTVAGSGGTVSETGFTPAAFGAVMLPEFRLEEEGIGNLKSLMKAAEIALSRLMTSDVRPDFAGISTREKMVRQEFFRARYTDDREGGSWHEEFAAAWLDGDTHGVGVLRVGVVEGSDGKDRTTVRHQHNFNCLFDPFNRNLLRMRYLCFIDAVPLEEAIDLYGSDVKSHAREWTGGFGAGSGEAGRVVPITQYYDRGMGSAGPTQAMFAGTDHVLDISESPFGERIPAAFMLGFHPTGYPVPIGRAMTQKAAAEEEQIVHTQLQEHAQKGNGVRYANMSVIDADEREAAKHPGIGTTVEVNSKGTERLTSEHVFGMSPPHQVNPALTMLEARARSERVEQSGISELQRGSLPDRKESATAMALLSAAGQQNQGLSVYKTVKYLEAAVNLVFTVAKEFDTEPVDLTIYGQTITFNLEDEPQSMISEWLSKPARATIGRQELTTDDSKIAQAMKLDSLMRLQPLVGTTIDPESYTEEMLRIMGYPDSDDLLLKRGPSVAPQQGAPSEGAPVQAGSAMSGAPGPVQGTAGQPAALIAGGQR